MIEKIIRQYKEKKILSSIKPRAEQFLRYAEDIKEEGGNIRKGSDIAQRAIILAKGYSQYKTEVREWADGIIKRAISC